MWGNTGTFSAIYPETAVIGLRFLEKRVSEAIFFLYALYRLMHVVTEKGWSIPAGFIHIPFDEQQASSGNAARPFMPLSMMAKGIEICLRVILEK